MHAFLKMSACVYSYTGFPMRVVCTWAWDVYILTLCRNASTLPLAAEEALACWMLQQLPEFAGCEVTRSRQQRTWVSGQSAMD